MKRICLITLVLLLLFLTVPVSAKLDCAVRQDSCNAGETALVYLSAPTNAHLSQGSALGYDHVLCCGDDSTTPLATDCSGVYDTFLKLSSSTNAHAEAPEQTGFPNPTQLCIAMPGGTEVDCQGTASACSALGDEYECVIELSALTNAHAAGCGSGYPARVCCKTVPALNVEIAHIPDWTRVNNFIVQWDEMLIDSYDVEYKVLENTTGFIVKGWTRWLSATNENDRQFGPDSPEAVLEDRTYVFRARVNMGGGNAGPWSPEESTSIDLTPPECSMEELPEYSQSAFEIRWQGTDAISGIRHYNIEEDKNDDGWVTRAEWTDWTDLIKTFDTITGAQEGSTYSYHCMATDRAGWDSEWSDAVSTLIDSTEPISELDPVTEWLSGTQLELTWSGSDANGIICYDVEWTADDLTTVDPETANWQPIKFPDGTDSVCPNPQTLTGSIVFDELTTPINEGDRFWFRIGSTDVAGRHEEPHGDWKAGGYWNVTIDQTAPYSVSITEDMADGELIIDSAVRDDISGVDYHSINYDIIEAGELTPYVKQCGSGAAEPYGGISECTTDSIDISAATDVTYEVEATDRAGNTEITDVGFITNHPLANFHSRNIFIPLGQSVVVNIRVKNLQEFTNTVQLILGTDDTTYKAGYYRFIGTAEDYLTEDNNRILNVELEPQSYMDFPVRIDSVQDIDGSPFFLGITAHITECEGDEELEGITDDDQLSISVGYPAEFPGIGPEAMMIIIALALAAVFVREGKNGHKQQGNPNI